MIYNDSIHSLLSGVIFTDTPSRFPTNNISSYLSTSLPLKTFTEPTFNIYKNESDNVETRSFFYLFDLHFTSTQTKAFDLLSVQSNFINLTTSLTPDTHSILNYDGNKWVLKLPYSRSHYKGKDLLTTNIGYKYSTQSQTFHFNWTNPLDLSRRETGSH